MHTRLRVVWGLYLTEKTWGTLMSISVSMWMIPVGHVRNAGIVKTNTAHYIHIAPIDPTSNLYDLLSKQTWWEWQEQSPWQR